MVLGHLQCSGWTFEQLDDLVIVSSLIEHLSFEFNEAMFPGSYENAYNLARYNLIEPEEFSKFDLGYGLAVARPPMFFYDIAQNSNLVLDTLVSFDSSCFGLGSCWRSSVTVL